MTKPPRPGEQQLTQDPADIQPDAGLVFIGHIETPWKTVDDCPRNARAEPARCRVHLKPDYRPGLKSLETCSHVIVQYWMHHARRDLIVQAPGFARSAHGCFALRSPIRPNPIALSVSRLIKVTGDGFEVDGLDCVDGTPLVDIKPYFARTDAAPDARVQWFENEVER